MGCGGSKPQLLENADGDEEGFHSRYLEDKVLGEGQFGVVKLVHDMKAPGNSNDTRACKVLRKGVQFKDNTLMAPIDSKILQQECQILKTLRGQHFCLELVGVYETSKLILMVTELCEGGEMMEYVSKQESELRTEDVSRIAFQLLDAVHHCAKHNIIHRDIKPENCMFKSKNAGAELRLIDFGSGCIDADKATDPKELLTHTTFAGSAFYISPEMFQKTYTSKTDVWSCGVTLYVLVAGYPAEQLQKAFNILQKSKGRKLRNLPNLPTDMPDSFVELLDKLLVFRHKSRPSAGTVLVEDEFVNFHKLHKNTEGKVLSVEDIAAEAAKGDVEEDGSSSLSRKRMNRTQSIKITGSVHRHALFLGYQKFERSVTTLLATLLSKQEFSDLLVKIAHQMTTETEGTEVSPTPNGVVSTTAKTSKLGVIPVSVLKKLLEESGYSQALDLIRQLPNSSSYETFAYHVALLKQFTPRGRGPSTVSSDGGRLKRHMSVAGGKLTAATITDDDSVYSNDSAKKPSSIHGNTIFKDWKSGRMTNPRKVNRRNSSADGLSSSWHSGS